MFLQQIEAASPDALRPAPAAERIRVDDSGLDRALPPAAMRSSGPLIVHFKANAEAAAVLVITLHRHSLGGGAIYTRTVGSLTPGVKLTTVLADHLGSTDVLLRGYWHASTSSFINQATEYQSFDAWGERRAASTQVNFRGADVNPFRTSAYDYDRGFTGHEQLDDSGLIHMNGRIYDPELGRFLAPDPYVQIPEYSQNFNRYSYCLNNPLNATDPSGFSFIGKIFGKIGNFIKENWRTIVVIVVAVVLIATGIAAGVGGSLFSSLYGASGVVLTPAAYTAGAAAASGAFVGAVAGGLSAALAGGDIGDILRGAVVGGVNGAITGGYLNGLEASATTIGDGLAVSAGHGILGGATNVAMGGKFQDGFLSAAVSSGANLAALNGMKGTTAIGFVERTMVRSAIGGTASVIGGGKFANGAYTSAFQSLIKELPNVRLRGKWALPKGGDINSVQRVYTNGILGQDDAQFLADTSGAAVYFNPSNGFFADFIESAYQKFFGVFGDQLTKGFVDGLKGRINPLNITAHSQGTITVANAAMFYGAIPNGSQLQLDSPAITTIRANLVKGIIGGSLNYNQPYGDGANIWASSFNPIRFISGLSDFTNGFSTHINNNTFEKAYGRKTF